MESVNLRKEHHTGRRAIVLFAQIELEVRVLRRVVDVLPDCGQVLLADRDGADEELLCARQRSSDGVSLRHQHYCRTRMTGTEQQGGREDQERIHLHERLLQAVRRRDKERSVPTSTMR